MEIFDISSARLASASASFMLTCRLSSGETEVVCPCGFAAAAAKDASILETTDSSRACSFPLAYAGFNGDSAWF